MHHNTTKPTARSRAHAQRMSALARTGGAGSYQPVALTPLYGTPPPCVFLGAGPKPKSKKDKGRREPNVLHRAARKPWARWTELEKAELSFAANHQFWLATEAWMDDLRKDLLPVLPKNVDRISLKPFHVAVLAGHIEVVRAFIEHRPAARRDGCYREFLVETTKNASTPFTAIELAALAGRPDVYRFLAGLQNGLGASNSRGKKRPLWSTKCERHANAGYEAAMARLAQVELDPRIPLDDEAGPRLRVAHYAQILAYFGMKPPVPEPPPVDMRRRNTLRVLESGAASDAAPAVDHRAKLVAFYEKHNPAKLDSIDATLAKYAGRESELFEALRAKYEAPAAVEEKSDAPSVENLT